MTQSQPPKAVRVHLSPGEVPSLAKPLPTVPALPELLDLLLPPRTRGPDVVSRVPAREEGPTAPHYYRMPLTEPLTERTTEQREKQFLSFSFEEVVEEEGTEEGRDQLGPQKIEGPNTDRGLPILQLSRVKSCGGANSTPGLNGAQTARESDPQL